MTGLWIFVSVLLVLFLLGQLRVGAIVEYSERGISLAVRLGQIHMGIFPAKKDKTPKPKKKEAKPPQKKKPVGGLVKTVVELLPVVLETIKKLFQRLRADKLELLLTISCPDPADTAIRYGHANALLASLWHPLTQALDVQDGHAHVDLDYDSGASTVYLYLSLSLKLWQLLTLALVLGAKVLRVVIKNRSALSGATKESEVV